MRFRSVPQMEIPADLPIPTCAECGTEWIDEDTAQALNQALEVAYNRLLRERAQAALEQLRGRVPQHRIEQVLGLSQGYISKIRSGKAPSEALVASLMLFAQEPNRVEETEQHWAGGRFLKANR